MYANRSGRTYFGLDSKPNDSYGGNNIGSSVKSSIAKATAQIMRLFMVGKSHVIVTCII